jgi:hypothetical protein
LQLSSILFLFLTHLGVGIACTLVLVDRAAGVKFFRFNAGLGALILGAGFALRPVVDQGSRLHTLAMTSLLISEGCLVVFWAIVGRRFPWLRRPLIAIAIMAGLVAVIAQGLEVSRARQTISSVLTVVSFLSSVMVLGGACGAMILGHWYLVIPSLDVSHLQSLVKFHIGSILVRIVVVAAAIFLAIATWQPGAGPSFERYILSSGGIFFWQRVLFGLAGPVVLAYLTWETAKIRSTQSATGILYVDFFAVIVGEVLAKYLLLATAVPV